PRQARAVVIVYDGRHVHYSGKGRATDVRAWEQRQRLLSTVDRGLVSGLPIPDRGDHADSAVVLDLRDPDAVGHAIAVRDRAHSCGHQLGPSAGHMEGAPL